MVKILIVEGDRVRPLDETKFTLEGKLQDYLEKYPSLIPLGEIIEGASDLLCIGREVGVPSGSIDLLFIDKNGLLTIVETKLAKNPEARRAVVGQIIEYASYIYGWTADKVYEVANAYLKSDLDVVMGKPVGGEFPAENFRNSIEQNLRSGKIRLLIAVDELVEPLRATITFLNKNSSFDILLLSVKNFEESQTRKVLIPTLFGYTKSPLPPPKRIINEEIFLARCREGKHKRAEELYFKAKELVAKREDNGDFINWGVSSYSYRIPWKGYLAGETIFLGSADGNLGLWLYVIERSAESGQRYLDKLRNIAYFSSKVGDYKRHKEPSFSTDRMKATDVDAFISAVEELGRALDAGGYR